MIVLALIAIAFAKPSPPALVYSAPAIAPFGPAFTAPIAYSPLTYAAPAAPIKPLASYSYSYPYAYNYGYNYRAPYASYSPFIAA